MLILDAALLFALDNDDEMMMMIMMVIVELSCDPEDAGDAEYEGDEKTKLTEERKRNNNSQSEECNYC